MEILPVIEKKDGFLVNDFRVYLSNTALHSFIDYKPHTVF